MTKLKKLLESKMKIRFHDCDPFNHLNNARYIDYFVTARGDQLIDNYDFNIYEIARDKGLAWVSAQTQISYLVPALLMEEVIIETRLIECTNKSLLLEAVMWDDQRSVVKSVMWAKLVHYNLVTQTSHQHSADYMEFFLQVVDPLPGNPGFEDRVKSLRSMPKVGLTHTTK